MLTETPSRNLKLSLIRIEASDLRPETSYVLTLPSVGRQVQHFPLEQCHGALDPMPVPIVIEAPEGAVFL